MTYRRARLLAAPMLVLSLLAAAIPLALVATTSPAAADSLVIEDPDNDAADREPLDIQHAVLANGRGAVVVTVHLDRVARGDVVVAVQTRARDMVAGVGIRRGGDGRDRSILFDDRGRRSCAGFVVRWDSAASTARMRLPARCLAGGDYGAVRAAVITERGADVDFAPQPRGRRDWTYSRWVVRG